MTAPPTILVLRALGLGDLVTGLPALELLRAARPEHRIILAAPRTLWPLLRLTGSVDDLVPAHELEPIVGAPQHPELAIDLHGNGPESVRLLLDTNPSRVLAFAADDGPRWSAGEHEVARWCRLLTEGLRIHNATIPSVAGRLAVPSDVEVPTGMTVVHCGAKSVARRWPPHRFAEVSRRLQSHGHQVVITGGRDEAATAIAIANASGAHVATQLSLVELAALVASARLVISGDTGVAHLAAAYETPSVTLFGPVSPAVWGPPPRRRHQVLWHGDGCGDPHGAAVDRALLRISPDEVMTAVAEADASTHETEEVAAHAHVGA